MSARLVFLKLGGSLITVKDRPHTPRLDVLERLAQEIAGARAQNQNLQYFTWARIWLLWSRPGE